jgi:hypothetical protein
MAKGCPNCGSTEDWFAVGDTGLYRCPSCFMTVNKGAPRNKAEAPPKPVESKPLTSAQPAAVEKPQEAADKHAQAVARAASEAKPKEAPKAKETPKPKDSPKAKTDAGKGSKK